MESNREVDTRRAQRLALLFIFVSLSASESSGVSIDLCCPSQVCALYPTEPLCNIGLRDGPVKGLYEQSRMDEIQVERTNRDFGSWRSTGIVKDPPGVGAFGFPIGDGGFDSQLPKMAQIGRLGVDLVSPGIGDPLSPSIDEKHNGADRSPYSGPGSSSYNKEVFHLFLFQWGHNPFVLVVWWGIFIFGWLWIAYCLWGIAKAIISFLAERQR